jgi:glycosyltransferase involved in cell wall biosynthesis
VSDSDSVQLAIIVPAFNEAHGLRASLDRLASWLRTTDWDWEIRVVDDGSADGTADIVAAAASAEPRVVLQREAHRGKGGAVRAGMLAARASLRFMCDADLSMPPRELPRFIAAAGQGAHVAIGSREGASARRIGEPWWRHGVGRVFNFAIQRLAMPGIADTQCGFKLFTGEAADAIFADATLDGWAFDVEVLALARAKGRRIVEVPIEWHHRAESQLSVARDSWRMLRDVVAVRRRFRK